jgi:hypothetical protein
MLQDRFDEIGRSVAAEAHFAKHGFERSIRVRVLSLIVPHELLWGETAPYGFTSQYQALGKRR